MYCSVEEYLFYLVLHELSPFNIYIYIYIDLTRFHKNFEINSTSIGILFRWVTLHEVLYIWANDIKTH